MKKLIVLLFMLLPAGLFSQEVKIAVVNASEVFNMMPELTEAETQFANFSAQYQNDINAMQEEYTMKYQEYMKIQDTLTENLKLRRQEEIQNLGTRIENFYQVFQEDSEKERVKLMTPIQEKLQKAIKDVGDEQGYTVVFDIH
jgi:outer membrane protein